MSQHPPTSETARRAPMWPRLLPVVATLLAGCSAFKNESAPTEKEAPPASTSQTSGPGKFHHRESQYVFYSDFPLKADLPLFKELGELRDQVFKELQLPESNRIIQVFLFEDQERYEKFMRSHYPDLPVRRAFFIKQPRHTGGTDDLLVFTYWHEEIRKDLRHELTHGLLHSVLRDVPLWLDEGLAEVFELPPENQGVNGDHLRKARNGAFRPDLAKLEQLGEVKQMQRPEYCEAWAWTHLMLRGRPEAKAVLLAYLQQLRAPNAPGPIQPKLREAIGTPEDALTAHLEKLEQPRTARASGEKR